MNGKVKIFTSLFSALALLTVSAGCSKEGAPSLDWKYPKEETVAHIEVPPEGAGDRFNITYGEWYSEYSYNMLMGGYTEESHSDVAQKYRQNIIDYLVREKIFLYLAEQAGITYDTLTEEEKSTIDKNVQDNWNYYCTSYATDAANALGSVYTKEELYDKEFELFTEFMAKAGLTPDIFVTWEVSDMIWDKLLENISKGISDDEVNEYFQSVVDDAKEMYENDLAAFESSAYTSFYIPEGTRTVQQLCVRIDADDADEIRAYRKDGDDEKADELLNKALEVVRFRIDEAYEKLQSGEDWAEVQKEYSDDNSGIGVDYTVYPTSTVVAQEFTDAAMGIEEKGGISEIIVNDAGFFILCYIDDRAFSDEELKELLSQAREFLTEDELYNRISDFKEKYPYVYHYDILELPEPVDK